MEATRPPSLPGACYSLGPADGFDQDGGLSQMNGLLSGSARLRASAGGYPRLRMLCSPRRGFPLLPEGGYHLARVVDAKSWP
jgi:hypothetical protein